MHGAANPPGGNAPNLRLVRTPAIDIEPPEPTAPGAPVRSADFDALTDLFLGDGPAPGPRPKRPTTVSAPAGPAPVEVLVLGHLPVRAAPWCAQYARHLAQRDGAPVAVLRLAAGEASVDLYGSDADSEAHETIEEALREARRVAGRWLLHADEVDQPALALDERAGAVTVLSGVNDAAVVAAYRALKGLAGASESLESVNLVIVGAPDDEARAAAERIINASLVFLERPIQLNGVLERIGSAPRATLFHGPCIHSATELLGLLAATEPTTRRVAPVEAPEPERPRSEVIVEPRTSASAGGGPALCSLIAGLRPMRARCPDDERTELAVDERGRLHLLRHDDETAYERLAAVLAWARRHASLLSLTGADMKPDLAPVAHLFTQRARERRGLLDAEVRVHVVTPPSAEWTATALN